MKKGIWGVSSNLQVYIKKSAKKIESHVFGYDDQEKYLSVPSQCTRIFSKFVFTVLKSGIFFTYFI